MFEEPLLDNGVGSLGGHIQTCSLIKSGASHCHHRMSDVAFRKPYEQSLFNRFQLAMRFESPYIDLGPRSAVVEIL